MDIGASDRRFQGPIGNGIPPFRWGGTTTADASVFRARLEDFERHVQQKHHMLFKRVAAELLTVLVNGNPVGNPSFWKRPRKGYVGGHSRRNWQIKNAPAAVELPGVDKDQTPPRFNDASQSMGTAVTDGYAAIGALPLGTKRVFLVNPTPYMERLNRGWSRQAPAGWIDAALRLVLNKYRKVT